MLLFLLFLGPPVLAEEPQYDIVVSYQDETHQIEGKEEITFINSGSVPVSELYLFLYPNIYRQKHPGLDRSFYREAYPVSFNAGGLDILSIQDDAGNPLSFSPDVPDKNEGRVLVKVRLSKPVLPFEQFQFSVRFITKIPQKWGTFGYYGDLVTLQGGWHPYLAPFVDGKWKFHDEPQKAKYRIHMTLKTGLHLLGSTWSLLERVEGDDQIFLMEGDNISFFSLSIGHNLVDYGTKVDNIGITYHALSKDQDYAEQVVNLSEEAVSYFLDHYGPFPSTDIVLTGAGLYQDLTTPGTNLLYVNTRIFKIFSKLKRFQEASLAYGLYRLLWRKSRPDEAWWVIECLARHDAEAFMQDHHGKAFNLEEWLKPIAFIPLIDQILYSESLPMRQIYFKGSVNRVVSEDIRFYNNPPAENPNIFSKLRSLIGDDVMDRVLSDYRGKDPNNVVLFREVLAKISGRDLNPSIDQWLTVPLKLDFEIVDIKEKQVNGAYETSIYIRKHGDGVEPLQVVVHEKDGPKIPLVWNGVGRTHQFDLKTQTPIKMVELDPEKLSSDPNRLNNRVPKKLKVLLDNFNLNYDFQTKKVSYRAGLLFQRLYDTKNWVQLRFAKSETSDFLRLGYAHRLKKNHVISSAITHERLESDTQDGRPEEDASFITLGYSFVFPDIPLLTESVQRLTTTFPLVNVGLIYNQQFNSEVYENSFMVNLDLRRLFPFSNYHEIATKVFIGQSFGRLFEENRFFLGGANAMRGYTSSVFEGENISLYSVEYRFPLLYETDINFSGLAHIHTWQGTIFTDTGMVSDSHNVFKVDQYKSDVGFGLRLFVDLFGVYPSILRADVALPIASPTEDEKKPHYYLNFGQSF